VFAFTSSQYVGMAAYLAQYVLIQMSQPLSFAFAMYFATVQARTVISAWLNVTFWLGNALAAPVTGYFLGLSDYRSPILLAAVAMIIAATLNQRFFHKLEVKIPMMVRSTGNQPLK
jgi:predicted MFS family arabinose efflux permease